MKLEDPSNEEMEIFWRAPTRSSFLRLLELFLSPDIGWYSPEHREYAKSCVISNAVELKATSLLPDGWVAWWAAVGIAVHGVVDISWLRRERWANLDRLAPLETRA